MFVTESAGSSRKTVRREVVDVEPVMKKDFYSEHYVSVASLSCVKKVPWKPSKKFKRTSGKHLHVTSECYTKRHRKK